MGDAVGDDAGLAAARAGKDQEGSFDVAHRLFLPRIEPGKKIHRVETRN